MQYDIVSNGEIRVYHTALPVGRRDYREHYHTELEISLILSGRGSYLIDREDFPFRENSILVFGSDAAHCITEVTGDAPFDMLSVKFDPRLLWKTGDDEILSLSRLFFRPRERRCIDGESETLREARDHLHGMERELHECREGYRTRCRLQLYSILLLLLRELGEGDEQRGGGVHRESIRRLELAMDYIGSALTTPLTLGEIAARAAMSAAYFSTVFKKYNGITPWEYITAKRVELAIEHLREGRLSRLEIAEECGFSSPANFYKAFRRVTGRTPGDYAQRSEKP